MFTFVHCLPAFSLLGLCVFTLCTLCVNSLFLACSQRAYCLFTRAAHARAAHANELGRYTRERSTRRSAARGSLGGGSRSRSTKCAVRTEVPRAMRLFEDRRTRSRIPLSTSDIWSGAAWQLRATTGEDLDASSCCRLGFVHLLVTSWSHAVHYARPCCSLVHLLFIV